MKIMIVDDERDVEILFRQQFRKEVRDGLIDLCYAFSGEEALEYLRSQTPPDVVCILSDINMPVMKGFELLKIVKERYPGTKRILITAYNVEDYLDLALRHDIANVLVKTVPVNTRELSVLVRNLLRNDIFGMAKYFDAGAGEKIHGSGAVNSNCGEATR